MSRTGFDLGQYGLGGANAPDDGRMAQFQGTVFTASIPRIGDMAFRLHGETLSAVPEPSSLALGSIAGLMGLGYAWRRRRRAVA